MLASVMYGPSYEAQEPDEYNIELFDNVGEATLAMFNRHRAHGRQPLHVALLSGDDTALTFPAFTVGTYFQLYEIGPGNYDDGNLMRFTEHQKQNIIAMVGNKEWDWHLSLNNDGYDTYVKVSMA